jgi:uncharacterized membrane protein YphA (DoxX/SURF4 family)
MRIAFRFACSYLPLFIVTFPPTIFRTPVQRTYVPLWNNLVDWTGKHLLHLKSPIEVFFGDTVFEWVLVLSLLLLAAIATVVWSWIDRRRSYVSLHEWLRLVVRLWLAAFLISYGAVKVFPAQFPPPSLARYLGTYGSSSPWGLMWTFIGASRGYQFFTGALELTAGVLIVVPQLTTLGALLAVATLSNVLALNIGYDIHVKLFSAHLLAAALFLAAPDLHGLFRFFVERRAAGPRPAPELLRGVWMNRALLGLQIAFGLYVAAIMMGWSYHRARSRSEMVEKTPFYGIWTVDEFVRDGVIHAPLTTDELRWQRVVIESSNSIGLQMMNGDLQHYDLKLDLLTHVIEISGHNPETLARFAYASDAGGRTLALQGEEENHPLRLTLHRVEPNFLLMTRGVRWVHPFPPETR